MRRAKAGRRGVGVQTARKLLLQLPNVVEGRSYGMPSFLLNGRFFARFRDDDSVLVLQLATIDEREVLIELDPDAFFFTEHYRNYPAVLVRLAEVSAPLLTDVVAESWRHVSALPPRRPRRLAKRGRAGRRSMRHLAILFIALGLAACSATRVTRSQSQAVSLVPAEVKQFLLTSAATDFRTHRPPDPVRFRDVRIGHVMTATGKAQYMLCGQFLPAQEGGKAEWTPFATIKTSDYEQWIGAQAASFCQESSVIWDKSGDLSSALQSRLETTSRRP